MFPHTIEWLLYVVAFVGLSAEARADSEPQEHA